ncbi:MAG TPA: M14 family metallopeptidase [Longimicrobiales bacterium]
MSHRHKLVLSAFAAGMVSFACASGGGVATGGSPRAAVNTEWMTQPLTVAERSNYESTSTYEDVMAFLRMVVPRSPYMHLDTIGFTFEKRAMPVVVVGRLKDFSPAGVRASGKTVVWVQGNIHAGEVEGKEAAQIMLRELAAGAHQEWLDSLVLVVDPIYNADGNERFSLTNRPMQYGPINGMGQRPNAQGYDLNRDHMKLDSPEATALITMMNDYNPHVGMDLHTTNGSVHGYHLTYAAPMHPNTDSALVRLIRQEWFPTLTRNVKQKHGWDFYYYGDFARRDGDTIWSTFEHTPRFNNNYLGLRNRFGLLSEAYSYATFEDRVTATRYFLDEMLDWAYHNATRIREVTKAADAADIVGKRMALRAVQEKAPQQTTLLVGGATIVKNPKSGANMRLRTDEQRPKLMYEYGTFAPTVLETVPSSYIIPNSPALADAIAKLRLHGVQMTPANGTYTVEKFHIDSARVATREFQGHRERTLFGSWNAAGAETVRDGFIVNMRQPLARLAFVLIEPRSDDGLADWNVLDAALEGKTEYPIWRVR